MAIELNERDYLIFKRVEEHRALLEKHISWLICNDDHMAVIRNRLRKLYFCGYLLRDQHSEPLAWLETPSTAFVYRLSSAARSVSGCEQLDEDLLGSDEFAHYIELANLRTLFLREMKAHRISDCSWKTIERLDAPNIDATVSFNVCDKHYLFGVLNHPRLDDSLCDKIQSFLNQQVNYKLLIVSSEESHQRALRKMINVSNLSGRCLLSTHRQLYKCGIVEACLSSSAQLDQFIAPQPLSDFSFCAVG